MEHAEQMLELYHKTWIFCGAAAIVLLAVSAGMFICFRIPQIWKKRGWIFLWICLALTAFQGMCQGLEVRAQEEQETEEPEESEKPEDDKAPEVQVTWKNEAGEPLEGFYQTGSEFYMELKIQEENLDEEATQFSIEAYNSAGGLLDIKEVSEINGKSWRELKEMMTQEQAGENCCWELQEEAGEYGFFLRLQSEARYCISAKIQDLYGNLPEDSAESGYLALGSYCLDRTGPVISKDTGILLEAEHQTRIEKLINQITFGCFCQPVLRVEIQAFDAVAGVEEISYICEGVGGEEEMEPIRIEGKGAGDRVGFSLPASFRGTVRAAAWDQAGHSMEEWTETAGILVESEAMHQKSARLEVTVMEEEEAKEYFCREDVRLKFVLEDSFSGIRSYALCAGTQEEAQSFEEPGQEMETKIERTLEIPASENNGNYVPITAQFTDFAGHITELTELPILHIDTQPPRVEVEWLNQDVRNEMYYRMPQTARITIWERNFVPDRVRLELTGMEPKALTWAHQAGKGCTGTSDPADRNHCDTCAWISELVFEEDGIYTFGCSCQDAAGNTGSYGKTDTFVIDRTPPVLEMHWDGSKPRNGYYYAEKRSAVLEVKEKNLSLEALEVSTEVFLDGQAIAPPAMGRLRQWEEESWRAGIAFEEDGQYHIKISCADLAGNEAVPYVSEKFVIDRTPPELLFEHVEDCSANRGTVAPELKVRDRSFDPEQTEVSFQGSNGTGQTPAYAKSKEENGFTLLWGDFEHLPENDDVYRIHAKAGDLAGNTAEAELTFSVNRFGSVYELDETSARLAGPGGSRYASFEPELVITEYNPDFLNYYQITCNREGEITELQKDRDYQVEETGTKDTWKTYRYRIGRENFTKEGIYLVTLYSEDRARNASSNRIKEKSLEFIVDKTGPGIVISGVKDRERIQGDSLVLRADVWDAYALKRAELYVNGKCVSSYDAKMLEKAEGTLNCRVAGSRGFQTFFVKAWDQAGNLTETEPIRFLVTEETGGWFVEAEHPKMQKAVLMILLSALAGICLMAAGRIRRRIKEMES